MPLIEHTPVVPEFSRLKCVIFGEAGAGKSYFASQFKDSFYIDTENLGNYKAFMERLKANKCNHVEIFEFEKIIEQVKLLMTDKHRYKTLIIDGISVPYNLLADSETQRLKEKGDQDEGRHMGRYLVKGKGYINRLSFLLQQLDMNVIITAQVKGKYETKNKKTEQVGNTFDGFEKLGNALGAVFELKNQAGKIMALIHKSRYETELPKNKSMFEFSYADIMERFGVENIEKGAEVINLVTPEQLEKLEYYFDIFKVTPENVKRRLLEHKAYELKEITSDIAQQWIDKLKKKLEG